MTQHMVCNQCSKCGSENTAVLSCSDSSCHCHTPKTTGSEDWEEKYEQMWSAVEKQGFEISFKKDIKYNKEILKDFIRETRTAARESVLREALEGVGMKYLKKGDKGFGTQLIRDYHKGLDAARTAIACLLDT